MAVGKPRIANKHLPLRMYWKNGAYWFVSRDNKWNRLSADYAEALRVYAGFHDTMDRDRIDVLIGRYEREILPKRAKDTAKSRKQEFKNIRKVFGEMPPKELAAADAWNYFQERGGTQQARHEVRALSAVMGWAVKWGAVSVNPLLNIGFPTFKPRKRYVSDAEFVAVRDIAPPMVRYAMNIALITAMRQRDILSLERRQITDAAITVTASKTDKQQLFPMSADLKESIDSALKAPPPQVRRHVIVNRKGKPYTRDGFQSQWQRVQIKAHKKGLISERYTFHDIRAKSLSDAKTLEEARVRANHSDSRVTQSVYRRLPETATVMDISHLRKRKLPETEATR